MSICLESVPVPDVSGNKAVCVSSKTELLQVVLPTYEFVSLHHCINFSRTLFKTKTFRI